jgi:hypothetical protein
MLYQERAKLKGPCLKELLSFFPRKLSLLSFVSLAFTLLFRNWTSFSMLGFRQGLGYSIFLHVWHGILEEPQQCHQDQIQDTLLSFLQNHHHHLQLKVQVEELFEHLFPYLWSWSFPSLVELHQLGCFIAPL